VAISIRNTGTRSRRTGRGLLSISAFVVAFGVGLTPAAASPEEGGAPAPTDCSHVEWGWQNGNGPAYFGQRFGIDLPPQCRGRILEGLDA
jgi:hypothetical protein